MSMGFEIRLEHRQEQRIQQKLEQKLEQRLEQKMELKQELKQYIPSEFLPFIDLDNDEDRDLLEDSLPFLSLHELSHVLEHKRMLYIDLCDNYAYKLAEIAKNSEMLQSAISHDLNETAIDKAAYVVGQEACKYSPAEMAESHCALLQRVYRDSVERGKVKVTPAFMARCMSALKYYKTLKLPGSVMSKVNEMEQKLERYGKDIAGWNDLVELYYHTFCNSTTGKDKENKNSDLDGKIIQFMR